MKISNETKVGLLSAIAVTILVLGYNFLRGSNFFNKPKVIYAVYDNTAGLANSAPVMYRGLQIGTTGVKTELDQYASKIIVPITLSKNILIPKNSIAVINGSTLGLSAPVIDIKPGDDMQNFIKVGDTLSTKAPSGLIDEVTKQLNPVMYEVKTAVHSLDSVLGIISNTFDPAAKANFQNILGNVNKTTANLITTSASLQSLLSNQTGTLTKSFDNVSHFTDNLTKQNSVINSTLSNLDKASNSANKLVSNVNIDEPIKNLNSTILVLHSTISDLQKVINNFKNDKGTLGLLLKDPALYEQLHSLTFSLNTLVDDIKVNPKRYISLFGRKDKTIKPLTKPLSDTLH